MTRFLSPGRSFVVGFLLIAMVLGAQEPMNWSARLSDGITAIKSGHTAEAIQLLLPLSEQAKAFLPDDVRRAESTLVLGTAYHYHGQLDQAESLYREAIQWLEPRGERRPAMLAVAFDNLGSLRLAQARWQEAEELLGKARGLYTKTRNAGDPHIVHINRLLGESYLGQGRIADAVQVLEGVVETLRESPDAAPSAVAAALRSLATAYTVQARYPAAEALLEESLRINREAGQAPLELADGMLALGHVCLLELDTARAMPLLEKAARTFEMNDDSHLAGALSELGAAALQDGKYAIAKEYLGRALDINRKLFGWDHVAMALIQGGLAEAYFGERDYNQAEAVIQQAIAIGQTSVGKAHFSLARLLLVEATIEAKQRRGSEADAHYRQALDIYRRTFAADHPDLVKAQREYAQFTKGLRK